MKRYRDVARLAHGAATGRPPRHAWLDELQTEARARKDGDHNLAGCLGAIAVWCALLTVLAVWLILR